MKKFVTLLMLSAVLLTSCSALKDTDPLDSDQTEEQSTESVEDSDSNTESSADSDNTGENGNGDGENDNEPVALNTVWHYGYVGSSTNPYSPNAIVEGGESYSYTDVIELDSKGTKITFTDTNNGTTSANAYVVSSWKKVGSEWVIDLDGASLAGGTGSLVMKKTGNATVYTYVSALDKEYIRLCYRSGQTSAEQSIDHPDIMISKTDERGTAADIFEAKNEGEYYDVLEGKTISFIGDSYFAGDALGTSLVWPTLLATKYNMVYKNYGINGSTISNYKTEFNPMVDRYMNMADNAPDIVVVEGGRNDFNQQVPIGEDGSLDTATMKGATRYLLTKLREKYPNAVIIGITMWDYYTEAEDALKYSQGYTIACREYGEAFIEVCEDMGIPYINAMDKEAIGVDMTSSPFRTQYCLKESDRSHLNAEGMKKVLPVFEKRITEIYTANKSNNDDSNTPDNGEVDIAWNYGYVGSSTNASFASTINPNGIFYSYTDVITLGAKGTKITFTATGKTSASAYVISSWKKVNGEWVIDLEGANLAGGNDSLVMTATDNGYVYTYVSTRDGECIRLCYRSEQESATHTVQHPTVTITQATEGEATE